MRGAIHALALLALARRAASDSSAFADAADAPAALAMLEAGVAPTEPDVLLALDRGWWEPAESMLRSMRGRGEAVGGMHEVRSRATRIRDHATELINLLRVGANAEETVVACAFQWAQRPEYVYLNVKFSSRIDGPVTVLNVDNENVTLTPTSLEFEALGRQKPKTFRLALEFYKGIDPERSHWSFASVGRMTFTIAKAANATWTRLLADKARPKNMHMWYERQQALDAEVKANKEAKEKAAKESKEAAEKAGDAAPTSAAPAAPGAPSKSPPAKGAGGRKAKGAGSTGSSSSTSKGKGGGKGGGKAKQQGARKRSKAKSKEEL